MTKYFLLFVFIIFNSNFLYANIMDDLEPLIPDIAKIQQEFDNIDNGEVLCIAIGEAYREKMSESNLEI